MFSEFVFQNYSNYDDTAAPDFIKDKQDSSASLGVMHPLLLPRAYERRISEKEL